MGFRQLPLMKFEKGTHAGLSQSQKLTKISEILEKLTQN
jgi:hypothetical protein